MGFAFIPPTSLPTTIPCGSEPAREGVICRTVQNRVGPIREQARSHKALRCAYWLGGAGSGSLVTRSKPHKPEVLP
ncbi:hypothetical protein EDF87_101446 [Pseudomonas helmanticensis]|uniref:Uncharacterized protein n=1 Tax=Pseudomonas helmanticensis TaxID=1471381 RepID=A0A4R7VU89_9PSED|nr:hypothetical protein EDF87_101446 [Pseudomonas helmanticensis]